MLKRTLLPCIFLLSLSVVAYVNATGSKAKRSGKTPSRLELLVAGMPDSAFAPVEIEDLLNDEVYLKLAHEGWSQEEIVNIMSTAIADKKAAKKKIGYGHYAKQWLPTYGRQPGGDSLYMFIDTLFTEKMRQSVARTVPSDLLNAYYPEIPYNPEDRMKGMRNPGYFRPVRFNPSCGRIHWMTLHPEDPDKLYVVPDGAGIFKTNDAGKHWECITDRIPERAYRSQSTGYAIPVDPDDWDHVFAFMNNSAVFETRDGGDSWRRIVGATHKSFKRGDCFRDADGNLKFIGCTTTSWNSTLWISEDTCKTWTAVVVPDSLKDIHPSTGAKGLWFQYIVTDPTDRNRIYLPTSRSILYFDDGAKSTTVDGKKVYNIKKLHFKVYDSSHTNRRYANHSVDKGADVNNDAIFPVPGTTVGDMVINPNNPDQWWYATGTNAISGALYSAVYRSDDRGRTWTTLQDPAFGIGKGLAFGNELANTWLGGFGVNYADTTKLYGCSMSSAKSFDGGRTFNNYIWWATIKAEHSDGQFITVSASRHNADNHCIRSHKSGRVFRGSDGGMLMLDPNINGGEWTQIGGDMGQMLFYHIAVNEFGDQVIAGNTQDIDGQTYRYGRWGKWRGYEGCESFINPYTSAVYFPSTGYQGLQTDMINIDSWQNGTTRADVVSGAWYTSRSGSKTYGRSLLRCDDQGHQLINLEPNMGEPLGGLSGKFALCRDKGRSTLFVVTSGHYFKRSFDGGNTFHNLMFNGQPAKFSNSVIAADPNNSDILYFGQTGKVYRYYVDESRFEPVGEGLPNIPCSQLLFHEGSGDLYFQNTGSGGIYILEFNKETGQYAQNWRFWTKGYNSGKSGAAEINYTTQEMVIYDYGRGVWCADLEHPSDRYFDNGFNLRELSFKDGRRTIGIDTEWTIPLYYHYKWTVNDVDVENPYQYLRRALNPGDRVQLQLTLRESPDVKTLSSVFIVPEAGDKTDSIQSGSRRIGESGSTTFDNPVAKVPGHALYSNGRGRVDLGYVDYFFNDFTVDFWLKPIGDGTLLANRTKDSDTKGWELSIENGQLKFEYAPRNVFVLPYYESGTQSATLTGGSLKYNTWNHVAITEERNGQIILYLNGEKVASGARIIPESTLNNSCVLSLFGDAIEQRTVEAAVDELKIWTVALSEDQIRREMYSTNADNKEGLVAYYQFNGGSLENDVEAFTRKPIKSRVNAEVQYPMMMVPTCAKHVVYETISDLNHTFVCDEKPLLSFKKSVSAGAGNSNTGSFGVYAYDASQWQNEEDNLDTDYFDYYPLGYLIHSFSDSENSDPVTIEMHPFSGDFDANKDYRLYASDTRNDKQVWEVKGTASYDPATGNLLVSDVSIADLHGKKLLIASTKPSIELEIDGVDAAGILSIYDESMTTFPMSAKILSGLPEPEDIYLIESDGIVNPSGLYFAEGKASGELRLDLNQLGAFNSTVRATLRSNDNPVKVDDNGTTRPSMIPYVLDVRNRIVPADKGTAVRLINSRIDLGNVNDYSMLNGTKELTLMGWVRVDSLAILNSTGFNLMTFYHTTGNGVTGLRLNRGRPEFAQNSRVQKTSVNFTLTQADLGKWVHLAAVMTPNCIYLYLNGQQERYTYNTPATNPLGTFHMGKNSAPGATAASDNFSGAFDQVAIWSRALSQEEIVKYMYNAVPLNDPGLINYLTMDYVDDSSIHRDCYNLTEIKSKSVASLNGSVSYGEATPFPFESRAITSASDADGVISLEFPAGKERQASIATFRGSPFNYLDHNFQKYSALNQEYYGLTYHEILPAAKKPAATDTVTLTYRHRTIVGNENLAVAMRTTGTSYHLAGFVPASEVAAGVASFKVPLSYLSEASELMFFTSPISPDDPDGSRPATIQLSFGNSILPELDMSGETPVYVLEEGVSTIPIVADVIGLSRNRNVPVRVVVNESNYAKASQDTIDFSKVENRFNIEIDRSKIDKFGINPLTLNLEGATANELKLEFYLEPFVNLTLLNGDEREVVTPGSGPTAEGMTNSFRAYNPISTLEISAELLEGYLPEDKKIELEVITDLPHSMNIGNGTLLQNQSVTLDDLEHHDSEEGALHEGWNLIGNPYLTNLNLTKETNVSYNPEHVTKFVYHADSETGNYKVYDMTYYDAYHKIHPFQSYFVQTMVDDAKFTITPVAKEVEPSKKTMYYELEERRYLTFELKEDADVVDQVTIEYNPDGAGSFAINEDAPKLWSISGKHSELYAHTADDKEVAVHVGDNKEIGLGVKSPTLRNLTLSLATVTGLSEDEIGITDNKTGEKWIPSITGNTYEFTADPEKADKRFTVNLAENDIHTGLDGVGRTGYGIYVDENTCMINGLQGNAMISVYTPSGLIVFNTRTSEPSLSFTLNNGVYIVVIRENGKEYTTKIKV